MSSLALEEKRPVYDWRVLSLVVLAVRWVQGWIYWGGGSRRFIYAPSKLDPHAHHWMANKFQSAMPGAVFGIDHIMSWFLHHGPFLWGLLVLLSVVELLAGLGLLLGFFTRLSAFVSILLSAALMLLFGWQGATCIDEWTMSASNFAMGAVIFAAGGGAWSLDSWWMRKRPALADKAWFAWLGSGPWPAGRLAQAGKWLGIASILFTVGFYAYYRGSVVTPYTKGPVSASKHQLRIGTGLLRPDGSLNVSAYVNGGTAAVPVYIMGIRVLDAQGRIVEQWNGQALSALPQAAVRNDYAYNRIKPNPYGLQGGVGARAEIRLPPAQDGLQLTPGSYEVSFLTIEGKRFHAPANFSAGS